MAQSGANIRPRGTLALVVALWAWSMPQAHARADLANRLRNILPGTSVRGAVQGPQEYLWVATSVGLNRYDGRRFVFVGQAEGITGSVAAIAKGADGHLWAIGDSTSTLLEITENGVIRRGIPEMQSVRTLLAEKGRIWVGDEKGVLRVDLLPGGGIEAVRMELANEFPRIKTIVRGSDGQLWAGGEDGLWRIEGQKMISVWTAPVVNTLYLDSNANIYLGTEDRLLWKIPPGASKPELETAYKLNDIVRHITSRDDGLRWIATDLGVSRWHNDTFERFLFERDLPGIGAAVALEDHEGSLWVGTAPAGLLQLPPPSPFVVLGNGEQYDLPFGTYPSQEGGTWILTGAGKLRRMVDLVAVESYEVPKDLNCWSWRNIVEVSKGELWMTSLANTMLHLSDGRWERVEKAAKVDVHGARSMLLTTSKRMFVSYGDSGFAFLDRTGGWQFHPGQNDPCQGPIVSMAQMHDGRVAMATEHDGVCAFDGQSVSRLITFPAGTHLTTITADKNQVWAGSVQSGLFLWEGGTLQNVSSDRGLPSRHVGQVFLDHAGYVWLSSRDGVFRLPERVLRDGLAGRRERVFALSFGAEDGLPSITSLWGWNATGAVDPQGRVWIATTNGVVLFKDPGHAVQTPVAKAIIEEVVVNGENVPVGSATTQAFPRDRGNLFFRYTFPTFAHQHRLRFRYRLRGFDETWTTVGDRATAGFTNVPPGRYTFEVAAWFDGQDPAQPGPVASTSLELLPPFYSWWLFRLAVAVALAASFGGLWVLRQRQRRQQVRAITEERTRIARDLHDTLDQTFVAVGLQLQAATAKLSDPARAEPHIERANELIDRGLAEARGSIWALREEHPNQALLPARLAVILGEMVRGTSVSLKVRSNGPIPELPSTTRDELVKIMREAATNAIRHGKARKLVVEVEAMPGKLTVMMQDDGVGFDPKQTRPGTHGLQGMLERARGFAGTIEWQSCTSGPGQGTKVTASLPVKNLHIPPSA